MLVLVFDADADADVDACGVPCFSFHPDMI